MFCSKNTNLQNILPQAVAAIEHTTTGIQNMRYPGNPPKSPGIQKTTAVYIIGSNRALGSQKIKVKLFANRKDLVVSKEMGIRHQKRRPTCLVGHRHTLIHKHRSPTQDYQRRRNNPTPFFQEDSNHVNGLTKKSHILQFPKNIYYQYDHFGSIIRSGGIQAIVHLS